MNRAGVAGEGVVGSIQRCHGDTERRTGVYRRGSGNKEVVQSLDAEAGGHDLMVEGRRSAPRARAGGCDRGCRSACTVDGDVGWCCGIAIHSGSEGDVQPLQRARSVWNGAAARIGVYGGVQLKRAANRGGTRIDTERENHIGRDCQAAGGGIIEARLITSVAGRCRAGIAAPPILNCRDASRACAARFSGQTDGKAAGPVGGSVAVEAAIGYGEQIA